jgi:hypothetical protein
MVFPFKVRRTCSVLEKLHKPVRMDSTRYIFCPPKKQDCTPLGIHPEDNLCTAARLFSLFFLVSAFIPLLLAIHPRLRKEITMVLE